MITITTKQEMQQLAKQHKAEGKSIGFVPTMGYLHVGHLKLVKEAKKSNDIIIMSIFVNPLQFGPGEDYDAYPRNPERDKQLAEEAGVDILFMPSLENMYRNEKSIGMTVLRRTNALCGINRPGHFDGVVMVLSKLFNIILPDRAYFGLKDAQQFAVVSGLVEDLDFPLKLVPVETVRESSGLAVSSRNVYLNDKERIQAAAIYKSLQKAKELISNGVQDIEAIIGEVKDYMKANMKADIDYVELLSFPELEQIASPKGKVIIAAAVKFSKARLIDNIIIDI
ncbi:pantothenate synthetase [Siminovitchia terrae]|uniref:Pantothenate synthetase n=1 Tax=Siminovitchia terrae TaxID=1914933 RepID=A0A429X4C1_SIMTE|nr:pantoate--beta-alanine ligase [Siminovitchia terrae]RST58247.1 pantoate--beta-alanine ligase [Siminovitchia terrae]GIN92010.1 pantothenate synthetase [Siminovitchia terrae]GIN96552.1 pantothenate synthetase [Siminovitchia terrae]